eukprot:6555234-Prymnesium_polylepis.1
MVWPFVCSRCRTELRSLSLSRLASPRSVWLMVWLGHHVFSFCDDVACAHGLDRRHAMIADDVVWTPLCNVQARQMRCRWHMYRLDRCDADGTCLTNRITRRSSRE